MSSDLKYFGQSSIKPIVNGTIIKDYEVIRTLKMNGFETTYLCNDTNLRRNCVIKEFTPKNLACRLKGTEIVSLFSIEYDNGLQAFMNTAQLVAAVNQPNIVRINNLFRANKTAYVVMEYESGETLRQLILRRGSRFEAIEVESLLLSLCEILRKLHKEYLIHRNIRPESILIRHDSSPVLIELSYIGSLNTVNDETNVKFESDAYNAPELFDSDFFKQGPWTDIYSLGAVLYELIAGTPPPSLSKRIREPNLDSIVDIGRGKYGAKLLAVIDKCISDDYQDRPLSIEELLEFIKTDQFKILQNIYKSISRKAVQHFLNWAQPNTGLYIDEFVTFIVAFGVIDMTWREGLGSLWSPVLFEKLIDNDLIDSYMKLMKEAGFTSQRQIITKEIIKPRIEEYAATSLLDRQEVNWQYTLSRMACAKYCIKEENAGSREEFMGLMEEVINRYRGRVKKELEKLNR